MKFKDKKVIVVGLGVSGRSAALLLKNKGADVYATDGSASPALEETKKELLQSGVKVETGKHSEDFIKGSCLMVASPGVHDGSFAIKTAKKYSIPVITEIELASIFCKAPIVAITGTNGKSTTVTLTAMMINESKKKAVLCGNIGDAFCDYVQDLSAKDVAAVEASSFQLKRIDSFRPKVSAIININQNHFDWHADFGEYFDCKKNIFMNQEEGDFTVLNYDDENLRKLEGKMRSQLFFYSIQEKVKGAYYDNGKLYIDIDSWPIEICSADEIRIKGRHNISNALCASLCAFLSGATSKGIRSALLNFNGLDHRFKQVATVSGVRFIDDSKATTVDSCRAALGSCSGKVILIAGGRDKGSDFTKISGIVKDKVKALVLIGEARDKIRKDLSGVTEIIDAADMDEAVKASFGKAAKGDIVLLSPMCASFDMFTSYKHRGEVFCEAVRSLKEKISV